MFIFKMETMIIIIISFFINFTLAGIFAKPEYKDRIINLENAGEILAEYLPKISYFMWAYGLLSSGISSTASGALTG